MHRYDFDVGRRYRCAPEEFWCWEETTDHTRYSVGVAIEAARYSFGKDMILRCGIPRKAREIAGRG